MEEAVLCCLRNIGVVAEEGNFFLQEYLHESLMFISFIIELEQRFHLEIPPEYLQPEKLSTLQDVCNMLEILQGNSPA